MNLLGNSTLKSKYKSVLNVRERGYCNRSKTLQGCTTFPTRGQDQRPYPWPRISVDSCWHFLCPIRIDILQAHRITTVTLHLGVFQGIIFFPQGSTMVKSIVNQMIT